MGAQPRRSGGTGSNLVGDTGFERVISSVSRTSRGLLTSIGTHLQLSDPSRGGRTVPPVFESVVTQLVAQSLAD